MLTTKQLEKNKSTFLSTNQKYGMMTQELVDFLGEDLFIAPASAVNTMVGCYPGGLLHHIIKSCSYAIKVNEILPDTLKQPIESIVKTVFLSQIGRVFAYKMTDNEWSIKQGKMYDYNDESIRLRVGERSIFYINKFGGKLTEEEYQAILNVDKDVYDKMSRYYSEPLTDVVRTGFELAVMEEKNAKRTD